MFKFYLEDVDALVLGSMVLGAGGGGNPAIILDLVKYQLRCYGAVDIAAVAELEEEVLILPLAFFGAPLIALEKIPNLRVFETLLAQVKKDYPARKIVLMPLEIGGCNALTPLLLAAKYGLPILDADCLGRAFPTINLCKPALLNYSPDPTYVSDFMGQCESLHPKNITELLEFSHEVLIRFGSCAGLSMFLMSGKEAQKYVVEGSFSQALALGRYMAQGSDIVQDLTKKMGAKYICTGMIDNVFQQIKEGFLIGHVEIKSSSTFFNVYYQNEFLLVTNEKKVVAESPAIIILLDEKSGLPITTESLRYGLMVHLMSLPAPAFWLMPEVQPHVNYTAFNLEIDL